MRRRAFLFASAAASMVGARVAAEEVKNAQAFSGARFYAGDQEYLLADIIAPAAYKLGKDAAAYFLASKSALDTLIKGAVIDCKNAGPPTRWGGRVVYAKRRGEELTLQEALVAAGAARVDPQTTDLELITRLLALEQIARNNKLGLWALRDYRVADAEFANWSIGAFQLVEGMVIGAEKARSRYYLNFGDDYLSDFTAGARGAVYRKWAGKGFDLAGLKGARIRVRGFVHDINGPSIDLHHIKQLEMTAH